MNKKLIILGLSSILLTASTSQVQVTAREADEDVRAVWITTVYNSDFPKNIDDPIKQQEEFISYLDELQSIGINTIMIQVRPTADALYESEINPWSNVLTGTQGKYPGYDPLEFMVEQAHKRGMEIHAWLNPYRVTTSGKTISDLSDDHPAKENPSWIFEYNDALYYNPELEVVKVHIEETVRELVNNYDIDGVHFDDYFYPSGYPLSYDTERDGVEANERREHVNEMVRRVSQVIDETDSDVVFGISPMGIWKNDYSDISGSSTNGGESYYSVYADTRTWIQEGWIDYVVPQIYWEIDHAQADYETLVDWWSDEVAGTDVDLYIGQGLYKDVVAEQIIQQLQINEKYEEVDGSVFFTMDDILENRQNARDQLIEYYGGSNTTKEEVVQENTDGKLQVSKNPNGTIQLVINNKLTNPTVAPYLEDGTTLVPVRIISEELGAYVGWNETTKQITIKKDGIEILLTLDSDKAIVNGASTDISLAPKLISDTTMVPIRFISEQLNTIVEWEPENLVIRVN